MLVLQKDGKKNNNIWVINQFFSFIAGVEKNGVNPPYRGAIQWMYFLDSGM